MGVNNGAVQIELAASTLMPEATGVRVEVLLTAHLRCSPAAAIALRGAIDKALEMLQQGQQQAAAPAGPAATPELQRRFQIFMDFDSTSITKGGLYRAKPSSTPETDFLQWVAGFDSATMFFVIGHCDDIGTDGQPPTSPASRGYNTQLAIDRANALRDRLTEAGITKVHARGEQTAWGSASEGADLRLGNQLPNGHLGFPKFAAKWLPSRKRDKNRPLDVIA